MKTHLAGTWWWTRGVVVAAIGSIALFAGLAMMFVPGPVKVAIAVGVGILALEFAFARSWRRVLKAHGEHVAGRIRQAAHCRSLEPP